MAGGRRLRGLVRRRHAEGELFITPTGETAAAAGSTLEPGRDNAHHVEAVGAGEVATENIGYGYLHDNDITMERGSVDDSGAATYDHLNQNVPDGYVVALQNDFASLGFAADVTVDGAFGLKTRDAVRAFERAAGIATDGIIDSNTRQTISVWLKHGYTKRTPPGGEDDVVEPAPGGPRMITPRVLHFSQGDQRWGSRVLGRSSSISKQGCAISAIAMVLGFHGRDVDPGTLDIYLDSNNGYVGNSVKWGVAGKFKQSGYTPR